MATIITQRQPSWQAQLAANILGPLLGNYINKAMERTENAYYNKRMQDTLNAINPQAQTLQSSLPGFMPQSVPQSGNGWENAFRQNNNVMADFDANTANLASPLGTVQAAQPAQSVQANIPTLADMQAALLRNAGHASLPTLQAQFAPYMQAQEAARIEARKREAGEALANASGTDRVSQAWRYLPEGAITLDALKAAEEQERARWPQAYTLDAGGNLIQGNRNPVTGEFTPQLTTQRTLTPAEIAANKRFYAGQDLTRSENALNRQHQTSEREATQAYQTERERAQWQFYLEHPEFIPNRTSGNNAVRPGSLTDVDKQYITGIDNKIRNLQTQLSTAQKAMENAFRADDREKYQKQIDDINQQITALQTERKEFLDSRANPQQPGQPSTTGSNNNSSAATAIGKRLLGPNFNAEVKPDGSFGADRGDHKHGGLDFAMAEGSPITADAILGSNLRVVDINNDNPNDPSKYGCNVRLEGTMPDGQKYYYIFGHLKKGSITVKKGDTIQPSTVIGQVGSTGRSTGPHLHFEVKTGNAYGVDNKIDPVEFFARFAAQPQGSQAARPPQAAPMSGDIPAPQPGTQANNQGNDTTQQPQPSRAVPTVDKTRVLFRHSDGREISEAMLREHINNMRKNGNPNYNEEDAARDFKGLGYRYLLVGDTSPLMRQQYRGTGNMTEQEYNDLNGMLRERGVSADNAEDLISSNGWIPPYRDTPANPASSDIQAVTPAGIDSNDITPRSTDVTPQPQTGNVAQSFTQEDSIAFYRQNNPNDKSQVIFLNPQARGDVITQNEIDDWERQMNTGIQPTKSYWNNLGVHTRDDYIRYHLSRGYQRIDSDSNLINPLGTVGDNAHSPGPVHRNETTENTNAQIDELNGFTSGDIVPQNTGSPSWSAFNPSMFGFNRMPYYRG